jgi:exopolysaccharide production protein ExoQ
MTPGAALELDGRADAGPRARWLVFVTCAAALFAFAYGSANTWSAVQRSVSEGFGVQLDAVTKENAAGNPYRQAAGVALGLLGAWALVTRRRAAALRPSGALGGLITAYLALLILSVGWAEEPQLTIRRVIAFALMAIAVAGIVRLLPQDALVSFALFGSTAYVLIAIAAEGASGAFHPLAPEYRFSGVYHPNTIGSFAAVLVMAAACTDARKVRRWLLAAAVVGGAIVVLLSRSRSALVGLLVALVIRWLVAARLSRTVFVLAVCAWIACAAVLTVGDAAGPAIGNAFLASRSDSDVETLSGRTALWDELLRYVSQRPALGYGFGSFWGERHVQEIYLAQRWPVTEAHSTYIQQLLDVGVVGLTLYLLVMAAAVRRAIRRLKATRDRAYAFMICVLAYFIVVGSLETTHPNPGFLTFLLSWTLAFLAFRDTPPVEGSSRCAST